MKKRALLLIFASMICVITFRLVLSHLNDGFSLGKIEGRIPYNPKFEVNNPPAEMMRALLSQNFYYLGKGSQCFVFESEDHDIVLKFFRMNRYRTPKLTKAIRHPLFLADIFSKKEKAKQNKREALFVSCKIAFEDLQEESNLICLHINPTNYLHQDITLHDRLRRPYTISSDQAYFIVQKKGEQLLPYLTRLMKKSRKEESKKALVEIAHLLSKRIDKGIVDDDAVIEKNSGFRENKAFFLDIGAFSKKSSPSKQEILQATTHLCCWLQQHDPELAAFFSSLL